MTDLSRGTILVTGGAGLIGSAIVWALNRRGLTNIVISDHLRSAEKWKNLAPLRFSDYLEGDDLADRIRQHPQQFSNIKAIFHLGACSATTETDAAYLIHNNFEYTKMLCHFALVADRRFLYASSAATYGALEQNLREDLPSHSLRPLNMYGYSKHLFDMYAAQQGFLPDVTGIKYFNVFGPNEAHKGDMRSVVHKAFEQIRDTGRVSLFRSYRSDFADGCQRRDFLYVKDAAEITVYLAEAVSGEGLFNVGSGQASTWLELVHALFAAMEREPVINFVEMPEHLRGKYQYYTKADTSKLRSAGYQKPPTPLNMAVGDYVRNYLLPQKHLGDELLES